jgi:hypothetical protein
MTSAYSNEASMMPSLLQFFKSSTNFGILQEFINSNKSRTNKLSIGLLDWFNVNYAPEYNVEYRLGDRVVLVWQSYNSALSGYSKALFDPFARGSKKGKTVTITNGTVSLVTTLCQLNYFRWAIKNGVIEYVKQHLDEIYDDMIKRSNRGGKKSSGKKQKISISASKTLGRHSVTMSIKFG